MVNNSEKARENRVRRALKRDGYLLQKSRKRDPNSLEFGGYMVIDADRNYVVFGSDGWAFSASLEDVEYWAGLKEDKEDNE